MSGHIVTVESVLKHRPCYKRPDGSYDVGRIKDLLGDGLPLIKALRLALDGLITLEDVIWYATREGVLAPDVSKRWSKVVDARTVNNTVGSCTDELSKMWLSGDERSSTTLNVTVLKDVVHRQQIVDLIAILEEQP